MILGPWSYSSAYCTLFIRRPWSLVLGRIHMHIALYLFLVLGLGQKGQSGQVGQAIPVRVVRMVFWQYGLLWFVVWCGIVWFGLVCSGDEPK